MPPESSDQHHVGSVANANSRRAAGKVASRRSLFWWRCGQLLLLLVLVSLVAIMLLPAIRRVGPVTRMSQCRGNLKAIGRAVQQYVDEYGSYPPAYTIDADGRRLHSWRTLLLPYLGQKALYSQIDLSQPWHATVHDRVRAAVVPAYHCPALEPGSTRTGYLAVVTPESVLGPGRSNPANAIERPLDNLLICMEVDAARTVHWMSPFDLSAEEFFGLNLGGAMSHVSRDQSYSFYHWMRADGQTSSMSYETSADERRAMISAVAREPSEVQD